LLAANSPDVDLGDVNANHAAAASATATATDASQPPAHSQLGSSSASTSLATRKAELAAGTPQ
jgi:hypothetical protein